MTEEEPTIINGAAPLSVNQTCVALLDAVFDMATAGKVQTVGIIMVTSPGNFRLAAAGDDIDGLCAGAARMQAELLRRIADEAKTVLHKRQ